MTIATTQTFPGPAWDELPGMTVLESWPPTEPLAGVDVLVQAHARLGAEELDLLPDLRLVANYGVGYDTVDVAACRERGVAVVNTPGVLDAAVAELTLALILACRRQLVASDRFVRERQWRRGWAQPALLGHDLAGSTLGLVGMGRIGSEVARRAGAIRDAHRPPPPQRRRSTRRAPAHVGRGLAPRAADAGDGEAHLA